MVMSRLLNLSKRALRIAVTDWNPICIWLAVGLTFYASAYGIARWRKVIVMREQHWKDERMLVRFTGLGQDVRNNWRGNFKNELSPWALSFFRPLEFVENTCRGGKRPYATEKP